MTVKKKSHKKMKRREKKKEQQCEDPNQNGVDGEITE
jgi:hypothetical protein